jgi:hypothetical protein
LASVLSDHEVLDRLKDKSDIIYEKILTILGSTQHKKIVEAAYEFFIQGR